MHVNRNKRQIKTQDLYHDTKSDSPGICRRHSCVRSSSKWYFFHNTRMFSKHG